MAITKENEERLKNRKNQYKEFEKELFDAERLINRVRRTRITNITLLGTTLSLILTGILFLFNAQYYFFASSITIHLIFYVGIYWLNRKEKYGLLSIFIVLILITYSVGLGINTAYSTDKYITFEKDKNTYVVLTIYKDQFLYVPINKKTNKIKKTFNIIDIKDVESFSRESIGRVKM
ncbi:hypothetical protein AB1K89_03470 [Sporosarcina sp. 179-K 8C2 HS]|uniref:hypothetical protein n=1 Tax=Sporosarcina sp. 179-K 8C2 HS TaxID=3142387 RepID=UPI0039A13D26